MKFILVYDYFGKIIKLKPKGGNFSDFSVNLEIPINWI